ncbi:MAG: pur operon repressor [Clostridia bacterium]|nr:pur operon repressor [Clostridia bacterium]
MEKVKRAERLAVMGRVLTANPNKIFTLSYFCELFGAAKSTISEDTAILARTWRTFRLGTVETVTGAAGGVRYRPIGNVESARPFVEELCKRLSDPGRVLPGGYLYLSDILAEPETVRRLGEIIAAQYYETNADFVLTMETKGIPVALEAASALHLPLVIARRSIKVYEGGAVNISYVSGSGRIEMMSLSRRAVKEGQSCLIVDDFTRGGGTVRGMRSLMNEFGIEIRGTCFVLAMRGGAKPAADEKAVMILDPIQDGRPVVIRPGAWIK